MPLWMSQDGKGLSQDEGPPGLTELDRDTQGALLGSLSLVLVSGCLLSCYIDELARS